MYRSHVPDPFVGRRTELDRLRDELRRVTTSGQGRLLVLRGRRQVGKSTLLEQFLSTVDAPGLLVPAAAGRQPADEIDDFTAALAASGLEAAETAEATRFATWEAALRAVAAVTTRPTILVLDEFPYLLAGDPTVEGQLQRVWDRYLSRVPILLVLLGSDLSVMEMLASYDRPLYGRAAEMILDPLSCSDVAQLLDLDAPQAFDAMVVTGGLPRLVAEWRDRASGAGSGTDAMAYVRNQFQDSTAPLVVLGERALAAEFPTTIRARDVLATIGSGESTFARIGERAGIDQGGLARSLAALEAKRVVAVDRPLSARPSRLAHYRVRDPYLRFWLQFIGPSMERLLRGRGDLVAEHVMRSWPTYRGRAVEPLVRESVERLLPDTRVGDGRHVGRYWTRDNAVEVDLVVADRPQAPATPTAVGSVKWRDSRPFDARDLADLHAARALVPGAGEARTVAVGRAGVDVRDVDVALTPDDLLAAWS